MRRASVSVGLFLGFGLVACVGDTGPITTDSGVDSSADVKADSPPPPVDGGSDVVQSGDTSCGDTTSDPKNCGSCGVVCPSGSCHQSVCDHIVFVSSAKLDGALSGTAGADQECNALASGKLGGTFVAWVSVGSDTPAWRLYKGATPTPGRWVLPDKATVVASSFQGFAAGLSAAIDQNESGLVVTHGDYVMSNTKPNGDYDSASFDCAGFTSNSSTNKLCPGSVGTGTDWSVGTTCTWGCDLATYHVYCFQK